MLEQRKRQREDFEFERFKEKWRSASSAGDIRRREMKLWRESASGRLVEQFEEKCAPQREEEGPGAKVSGFQSELVEE